ncbi:hypothetical protein [Bosea sp. CS1GBMeth4]|uniref:hypothetical protein n=1 Tax=Bosea sp. CS1GBMeth4 TaxID=1892849 RepID=UPI0016451366|nr:hypothetical protein [Bosea sp. CS1GBMeth4]
MSYAEILVALGDDEPAFRRAAFAGALAGQLGAGLRGVMSRWPRTPQIEPSATIGMVGELLAEARTCCSLDLAAAETRFRDSVGARVGRVSFTGGIGSMTEAVLRNGRRADLIVIGPAVPSDDEHDRCDARAVLSLGGRPVMVVPSDCAAPAVPRRIAVAWRDCRPARRVLREALPLLRRAEQVSVIAMDEVLSVTPDSSVADVVDFLHGHGVPARATDRTGSSLLCEGLLRSIERDADLLVAPAYCSNQLVSSELVRQTTQMLTRCRIPCLLAN